MNFVSFPMEWCRSTSHKRKQNSMRWMSSCKSDHLICMFHLHYIIFRSSVLKDLPELSSSGHFLKGSSAALGLTRVQNTCERIQHCGAIPDEALDTALSEEEILERLEIMEKLLKQGRLQYKEAKEWLRDFFDNNRSLEDVSFYRLGPKTLV